MSLRNSQYSRRRRIVAGIRPATTLRTFRHLELPTYRYLSPCLTHRSREQQRRVRRHLATQDGPPEVAHILSPIGVAVHPNDEVARWETTCLQHITQLRLSPGIANDGRWQPPPFSRFQRQRADVTHPPASHDQFLPPEQSR